MLAKVLYVQLYDENRVPFRSIAHWGAVYNLMLHDCTQLNTEDVLCVSAQPSK